MAEVNEVHAKFITELQRIFEKHKGLVPFFGSTGVGWVISGFSCLPGLFLLVQRGQGEEDGEIETGVVRLVLYGG